MAVTNGFNVLLSDFPGKLTWRGRFPLYGLLHSLTYSGKLLFLNLFQLLICVPVTGKLRLSSLPVVPGSYLYVS